MSQSSRAPTVSHIQEITLSTLNPDLVIAHAEKSRATTLSEDERKIIRETFSTNIMLSSLTGLHNQFINIEKNLCLLSGLTQSQVNQVHRLIETRREYKKKHATGQIEINDMKLILATERELLPLSRTVEWWTNNQDLLKQLDIWENLATKIAAENKSAGLTEEEIRQKLHKLTDHKNEWVISQQYSGAPDEMLNDFYTNSLCKMEKLLKETIDDNTNNSRKWPKEIKNYLLHLVGQINLVKKSVVYSMYFRLAAAELSQDMENDDSMHYIADALQNDCQIDILKKARRPAPRRGLNPEMTAEFIKIIRQHCELHTDEKNLQQRINQSSFQNIPQRFRKYLKDDAAAKQLQNYACILFASNVIPSLLEQAYKETDLAKKILEDDAVDNPASLILKLHSALGKCQIQTRSINNNNVLHKAANDITGELKASVDSFIAQLTIQVDIQTSKKMARLIDEIFSTKAFEYETILTINEQLSNVNKYYEIFLQQSYHPRTDIILAIANKIKNIISSNQDITPTHITNIIKLLKQLNPDKENNDLLLLKNSLAKATGSTQKIYEENESGFLHLLVNLLETPVLTTKLMPTALERHRHINSIYGESWDTRFEVTPDADSNAAQTQNTCSYISNVLLRITPISPFIDLSNFNKNKIWADLSEMEGGIPDSPHSQSIKSIHIQPLKKQLDAAMTVKLNDLFQLKQHLYSQTQSCIDTQKLKALLTKINVFFVNDADKKILIDAIQKACESIIKQYCLMIIAKDMPLNVTHLNEVNEILGVDCIKRLCKDGELLRTIASYIQTSDGTKNNLAYLFKHIAPASEANPYARQLEQYARKRLDYIVSSRQVTMNDYFFFEHYSSFKSVASYLADVRAKHQPNLQKTIDAKDTPWNVNTACFIELLGNENQIFAYRLKRILELLSLVNTNPVDDNTSRLLFNEFEATIFSHTMSDGYPINKKILIDGKQTIDQLIMTITNDCVWSLLTEDIIQLTGSFEQLQSLHTNHTMRMLDKLVSCESTWLGKQLNPPTNPNVNSEFPSFSPSTIINRIFLERFYGAENLKKIITKMDTLLSDLLVPPKEGAAGQLTKDEYKQKLAIVDCIKPLATIYLNCGANPQNIEYVKKIEAIEKKIKLQYQLNTVLKQHSELLSANDRHIELHNLILAIIQAITKIEDKNILSETTINDYLSFIDKEILMPIIKIIVDDPNELSFKTLFMLANLPLYFSSERVKLLLLNANQLDISANPHWLMLINHLDESDTIEFLDENRTKPGFEATNQLSFTNTLAFAKHLLTINRRIRTLIQKLLLHDAEIIIPVPNPFKLDYVLSQVIVKNKQLISLWEICAEKLIKENLDHHVKSEYLEFIVNMMNKISAAIFDRARNNPSLLDDFNKSLLFLNNVRASLKELDAERDKSYYIRNNIALWSPTAELEKTLYPLLPIIDKTLVLRLMNKTETYLCHLFSKTKLNTFKDHCNNVAIQNHPPLAASAIKQLFGMKRDKDAVKIVDLIPLYIQMTKMINDQLPCSQINSLIDTTLKSYNDLPESNRSRHQLNFLKELKALCDQQSQQNNSLQVKKGLLKNVPAIHRFGF